MTNRVLGILIILGFILSGVLFYMYFFVYYMGRIDIKSNVADYNINLYNKKLRQINKFNCKDKLCSLKDISPFDYSIHLTKSGYIDIVKDIKISRNENLYLDINFKKKTVLNELIYKNSKQLSENINNKDKIAYLKNKKNAYFFEKLNRNNFYFKEDGNYLRLYNNNDDLGIFEKVIKEKISISRVLGTNDYIFITLGEKKYLYDLVLKKKYLFELNIDINYIKIGDNTKFIINTVKGSFIFDRISLKIEYFDFFRDFIYYEYGYIGIIDKKDTRRLTNLGLKQVNKNLIIYYNTYSKEKKILLKTDMDISKIYNNKQDIIFVSSNNKEYKLENY